MRLLVLDHFFAQDIDALRRELLPGDEIRTLSYEILGEEAQRIFPQEVTGGVEAFAAPENAPLRERYAKRLRALLEAEFSRRPFDAFVSPSDVFYYVRAAPEICHDLGVPFIVVQKETTVSGLVMELNDRMRTYAPPIADAMTACSQTLRDFWVRAGADPSSALVTGQPRFDYYRRPEWWEATASGAEPVVLFLSYHVDHHHPSEGEGIPVWNTLHHETEEGLWELARMGWKVLIKPHPQQPWQAERRRIRREAGDLVRDRVELVDPAADVRRLIVKADVIVGFQSTALIEAMIAERPIIYTGWDPEAKRLADDLLPFASRWRDLVTVVEARNAFVDTVCDARGSGYTDLRRQHAAEVIEEYLGVVDGRASQRTVQVIRDSVEQWRAALTPAQQERRDRLANRRPPLLAGVRGRQGLRVARRRIGALLGR